PGLTLVGSVVFSSSLAYADEEAWVADAGQHLVPRDSAYGWPEGKEDGGMYGWVVADAAPLEPPEAVPALKRLLRSLFRL
ncbi:unnamed protein product, partial [Phaeothamnion confervicola]